MSFKSTRPLCTYNAAGALVDYPAGHEFSAEDLQNVDERVWNDWKAQGHVEGKEDAPAKTATTAKAPAPAKAPAGKVSAASATSTETTPPVDPNAGSNDGAGAGAGDNGQA